MFAKFKVRITLAAASLLFLISYYSLSSQYSPETEIAEPLNSAPRKSLVGLMKETRKYPNASTLITKHYKYQQFLKERSPQYGFKIINSTFEDYFAQSVLAKVESGCQSDYVYGVLPPIPCYGSGAFRACIHDVAIGLLTSSNTYYRYISGGNKTWVNYYPVHPTVLVANSIEPIPEAVVLDIPESPNNMIARFSMSALTKLYEMHPERKWFMKIDDDAFMYTPNMLYYLSQYDFTQPLLIGKHLWEKVISGGAGYILSRALLKAILPHMENCLEEFKQIPEEDVVLTFCIQKYAPGYRIINTEGMYICPPSRMKEFDYANIEGKLLFPYTFHWMSTELMEQFYKCNVELNKVI